MSWVFTPAGALGILGGVLACSLGAIVYAAGPQRRSNRILALALLADGITAATGNGLMFLVTERGDAYGWQMVATAAAIAAAPLFALVLGVSGLPWTRLLRTRAAHVVAVGYLVAAWAYLFARPDAFTPEMVQTWYAPWDQLVGPAFIGVLFILGGVSMLALVASVAGVVRSERGSPARSRALSFMVAFGIRDASFFLVAFVAPLVVPEIAPGRLDLGLVHAFTASLTTIAYAPLLAYSLLRSQVLDIDLRIKTGLERSTIVAAFLAVAFVVEQLVQSVTTTALGVVGGLVAAALLLFAFRPIERLAERVADKAMPHVQPSEEYLTTRKHHVYRSALEAAYSDGDVTAKERAMLGSLASELAVPAEDAARIEASVRSSLSL